jgi:hypothetical protein
LELLLFEAARTSVAVAPPLPIFIYSEGGSDVYILDRGKLLLPLASYEVYLPEGEYVNLLAQQINFIPSGAARQRVTKEVYLPEGVRVCKTHTGN